MLDRDELFLRRGVTALVPDEMIRCVPTELIALEGYAGPALGRGDEVHDIVVVLISFGTVLLAAGNKGQRYALPHATIHLHQPLGGASGQVSDIEIQAKEFLRLRSNLNDILARHTGQPMEVIERDTERDFWMDAKTAVDYGLVDKVLEAQE